MRHMSKFIAAAALAIASTHAQALSITPTSPTPVQTGTQTNNNVINGIIESTYGVTELYKADVGAADSGAYAGSYETAFANSPTDPADATITYVGGPTIPCPDCFLLVKDGNQDPAWYLFDIGSWNGTDDIQLTGFWPGNGAISHVSIYGGMGVPEPGVLALLGIGLLGVGFRRFNGSS